MTKVINNWRYWLMMVIALTAAFNLFGMPDNDNPNYWLLVVYSKLTALALLYADLRLYVWFAKHRKIDGILEYVSEDN